MLSKIKRLFKKEEKTSEIGFDNLADFLESELNEKITDIKSKTELQIDLIINEFQNLKKIIDDMEGKKSNNMFADNVKNRFCARAKNGIESIKKPPLSYEKIMNFFGDADNVLKDITNISITEFRHMHEFKDDMGLVSAKTRVIAEKLGRIKKENFSSLKKIYDAEKNSEKIRNLIALKKNLVMEIGLDEKEIISLEEEVKQKKEELDKIINSREMLAMEQTNSEIKEIENRMKSIEQRISTELGIARILKKFIHTVEIPKHDINVIEKYIENPAEAFLRGDTIRNIIENIIDSIEKNFFSVDEKEEEKIFDIMRKIDLVESMKKHYFEMEMELNEKISALHAYENINDKKHMIKKEIDFIEKESLKIKNRKIEKEEELNSIKIDDEIRLLENFVSDAIGREVKIIL